MGFSYHSMIIDKNGDLYGCGRNNYGQLGLGNTINENRFVLIDDLHKVKQVSCGDYFSFALLEDGTVWSCGRNDYGQLGLNHTTNTSTFTKVSNISNVKQISCGIDFVIALLKNGDIWSCGRNHYGQLGLNDTSYRTTFTKVSSITNVKQISCGADHTFALLEDGTIWSCGYNGYYQLGHGDTSYRTTFTKVSSMSNVKQVCAGYNNSIILFEDGSLYGVGYNKYGELGLGDSSQRTSFTNISITNVKRIADAGYYRFALMLNDNTVYSSGYNNYGEIGDGDTSSKNTFTKASNLTNVKQVSCGYYTSIALLKNGDLYVCGYNNYGQLGLGDTTNRSTFEKVSNISNTNRIFNQYPLNIKFIIEMNGKYYSILDSEYDETTHMYNEIQLSDSNIEIYGVDINKLIKEVTIGNDTFKPIDKFTDFKLITNEDVSKIRIKGIRNSQMITTLNPIDTSRFGKIKSISGDYTLTNGDIKLLFSFDNGYTWNTYDTSSNTWSNVSVTIPIKKYTGFIERDILNWNNAKDIVLTNGIPIQDLSSVDFTNINPKSIMFAIAFNKQDYSDSVNIKKLDIEYYDQSKTKLAVGSNLSKYEARVSVCGDSVSIETADNHDELLITISTNSQ